MPHTNPAAIIADESFIVEWQAWHDDYERHRASPHGFLTVTDLQVLDATPRRIDGVPGVWSVTDAGVIVEVEDQDAAAEMSFNGEPVVGRFNLGPMPERASLIVDWGDRKIELAKRSGHVIMRPRDPEAPLRVDYQGTPTFEPDPDWVISGQYEPFDEPRPVTVDAALSGLSHVYESPGVVEFVIDDEPLSLTVFNGGVKGSLFALFRDATSGVTTYAATRSLNIEEPRSDGSVVLDFNRAVNMPCAYTDFATCPLPPAENQLPVAIEAGERIPRERLSA